MDFAELAGTLNHGTLGGLRQVQMELRWPSGSGRLALPEQSEVAEDVADGAGVSNQGDDLPGVAAPGAVQDVERKAPPHELGPTELSGAGLVRVIRHREVSAWRRRFDAP